MSKAEQTKKYIIERVAPVFNKKGYAATSLHDLTEATGLTKGAIYGNFKNKDEVAIRAFVHNLSFIKDRLRENILDGRTVLDQLLAYPRTFRDIFRQVLQFGGCPIVNTAIDSGDINEPLQDAVRTAIGEWKRSIVSLIENGIECGEFSRHNGAEATAHVLICLVEGGYAMTKATGDEEFMLDSLSEMESIILTLQQKETGNNPDAE